MISPFPKDTKFASDQLFSLDLKTPQDNPKLYELPGIRSILFPKAMAFNGLLKEIVPLSPLSLVSESSIRNQEIDGYGSHILAIFLLKETITLSALGPPPL